MSALKAGTDDKKKLILASVFGVFALGYLGYTFLGGDSSPAPAAPPASPPIRTQAPVATAALSPAAQATARIAPSRLDPTLHPEGMMLTESLVYSGRGRNIFAAPGTGTELAKATAIPKPIASARYVPPVPVNTGPPLPPPISLRYFGTVVRADGTRKAFLLQGEDVFVAGTGDIVSRRYKVGDVTANDIQVTDLTNNNTQRIPVTQQ